MTARDQLNDTPFARLATALAAQHGISLTITVTRRNIGGAFSYPGRRPRIKVGPAVLAQNADVQRQVAAHEVAHIVLNHDQRRWTLLLAGSIFIWLPITWMTVNLAAPLTPPLVGALTIGPMASCLIVLALSAQRSRRREQAADSLACQWGHHLTAEVAKWMERHETPIAQGRIYRLLRHHPLPRQRHARCLAHRTPDNH